MATKRAAAKKEIVLGCEAQDLVSGFRGIVACRFEHMNGNTQYTLQPPMKKGATDTPKPRGFDGHMLKYVGAGVSASAQKPTDFANLELGSQAKDRASGLVGIVLARAIFLNGCVYYDVQPPLNKDGELPEALLYGSERLERVGEGITATLPKKPEKSEKPAPGGPFRMARMA